MSRRFSRLFIRLIQLKKRIAANVVRLLKGSYVWSRDENRALQDPFSFARRLAVAMDENAELERRLLAQINSSDDNPAVIFGIQKLEPDAPEQVKAYAVAVAMKNPCGAESAPQVSGAVIRPGISSDCAGCPCRTSLELRVTAAAERINRLDMPQFTELSRFLTPEKTTLAYWRF